MGYVIAIIISRNILIRKKNAGDDTQKSGEFCVKNKKQGQSCAFLRKGCPFGVYGGRVFQANQKSIPHTRRRVASFPTKTYFVLPCPLRSLEKPFERQKQVINGFLRLLDALLINFNFNLAA